MTKYNKKKMIATRKYFREYIRNNKSKNKKSKSNNNFAHKFVKFIKNCKYC